MAHNMFFNFTVRDKATGEIHSSIPKEGIYNSKATGYLAQANACWGSMAWNLGWFNDQRELYELFWFAEIDPVGTGSQFKDVEEVRQALEHFFPKDDKYPLKWEITGRVLQPEDKGPWQWPEVRFYDFGDYPRQLMMSKLFVIRNMSRYANRAWRIMLDAGVPYGIAATLGSCTNISHGFNGKKTFSMEGYANIFNLYPGRRIPTVADIRNFANCERYLGAIGTPWKEGNGYKRNTEVMDSVCKSSLVKTNSPKVDKLGIHYGGIEAKDLEGLIYKLCRKKVTLSL